MRSLADSPSMSERTDVIVIGAGPTGSTAASLLRLRGVSVKVLEREVFPRFHVGESLLPVDLPIFAKLGVDPGAEGFLRKGGAEFLDEAGGGHGHYPFADALPGTPDHAFEVERSKFDHFLSRRSEELGAEVRYGERVTSCAVQPDHVEVTTTKGRHQARYLVDATGLDALLSRRDRTAEPIVDFGLGALFTHVHEIDAGLDRALTVEEHGNVKILFVDDGWCWVIPLGGRKVSMGMVTRRKGLKAEWLDERIERSPFLSRVTRGAVRHQKPGVLASFSFHTREPHGARWASLGDAAAFLDPIFSSGVSLGMVGAEHLVEALVPALEDGTEDRRDLLAAHHRHMGRAYNVFATLINSFYHSNLLHHLFFSRDQDALLRKGLTSVLAGDVWRDDNPFQDKLMASKRRLKELVPLHG